MTNSTKKPKSKAGVSGKAKTKRTPDNPVPIHQGRFNQLLDDAIFGVKKK